jgi:hypothetical protein
MDIALFVIGCVACLCIVVAAVIIMHPRIHEGLVIKAGLITLALGSFALVNHVLGLGTAGRVALEVEARPLVNAVAACSGGVVLIIGGLLWRLWSSPIARGALRLASGWTPLDDQPGAAD